MFLNPNLVVPKSVSILEFLWELQKNAESVSRLPEIGLIGLGTWTLKLKKKKKFRGDFNKQTNLGATALTDRHLGDFLSFAISNNAMMYK